MRVERGTEYLLNLSKLSYAVTVRHILNVREVQPELITQVENLAYKTDFEKTFKRAAHSKGQSMKWFPLQRSNFQDL